MAVQLLKSDAAEHSYGWQMQQGATTLWERWSGYESHNHPMFGSPVQMLFEGILGIGRTEHLQIRPCFTKLLDWAKGSAETVYGPVSVSWSRAGQPLTLELSVPCRTEVILGEQSTWIEAGTHRICL